MKHTTTFVLLTLALIVAAAPAVTTPPAHAQTSNRVALIIDFNGTPVTRCVTFDDPEITGYDVLERSGIPFVASFDSGDGAAVCKIDDLGCPAESCLLCDAPRYWSYWQLDGRDWVYSTIGSSHTTVQDGDVEGWSWGNGEQPPLISFDDICAEPTPTPTTDSPVATPTTPPPTNTPQPQPAATFRLDANPVQTGECTTVRWDTVDAQAAFLDGESVDLSGSQDVCPESDQSLTLRVVNDYTEQSYTIVLGVVKVAATATPQPTAAAHPTSTPQTEGEPTSTPPVAPTPTPTPTLTPVPSPTPAPSAVSPIATPRLAANRAAMQSPLPTPGIRDPIIPPPPTPTATIAPVSPAASAPDVTNYLLFGLMTGLLLIGLGIRGLRSG